MATITKDEYSVRLADYIRSQMADVTEGKKDLKFWVGFNQAKKVEFDEILANEGTTVEG